MTIKLQNNMSTKIPQENVQCILYPICNTTFFFYLKYNYVTLSSLELGDLFLIFISYKRQYAYMYMYSIYICSHLFYKLAYTLHLFSFLLSIILCRVVLINLSQIVLCFSQHKNL